jgi:hypothetical protein
MAVNFTEGLKYEALRKECLDAVRQWPGCESVAGIQIIRSNKSGGFCRSRYAVWQSQQQAG